MSFDVSPEYNQFEHGEKKFFILFCRWKKKVDAFFKLPGIQQVKSP